MLKTLLLATSVLVAVPAFAQEAPAQDNTQPSAQTAPTTAQTPPATADDAAPGTQGAGTAEEATPADSVAPATSPAPAPAAEAAQPSPSAPADATPAPATPAADDSTARTPDAATASAAPAAQPAATQDQVAQAVTRDFGTYDKDANGALSRAEFDSWMGTLRKASEPAFNPGSPDGTTWLTQAFAATDADKNQSVSNAELTTFLTPKAS